MLTLYDYLDSGNGYKVRLLLHKLRIDYRRVELDIDRGETRTSAFLARNPNGRVPTLELEDGTCLAESDAILFYLAEGTPFLPATRLGRAQVLQWMFFEQYSHEPYVATPRYIMRHLAPDHPRRSELPDRRAKGRDALKVMDIHLADRPWLAGDSCTIADIALYAYTHVADQAGIALDPYPAVVAWLSRFEAEPRHILITDG